MAAAGRFDSREGLEVVSTVQARVVALHPWLVSLVALALVAGCGFSNERAPALDDSAECRGYRVVVNYGILSSERQLSCIEFLRKDAVATEILSRAGIATVGSNKVGNLVVCRVNGLPSASEQFTVDGEGSHLETCQQSFQRFSGRV